MISSTIAISIKVKPCCLFFILLNPLLIDKMEMQGNHNGYPGYFDNVVVKVIPALAANGCTEYSPTTKSQCHQTGPDLQDQDLD